MSGTSGMPGLARASLVLRLFRRSTIWGTAIGALLGLLVCGCGVLLMSIVGEQGRAVSAVWGLHVNAAARRGALLGLLTAWLGGSRRFPWAAWVVGTAVVVLCDAATLHVRCFIPWAYVLDAGTAVHFAANTLLICAAAHLLLARAQVSEPDPKGHDEDSEAPAAPMAEAAGSGEPEEAAAAATEPR